MNKHQAIFGSARQSRVFRDFILTRTFYPSGTALLKHSHENVVLSFAVAGGTSVSIARTHQWCDRGALLCLPAGVPHANSYPVPATRLHVELTSAFWGKKDQGVPTDAAGTLRHPIAEELRGSAIAAFLSADNLSEFALSLAVTDVIGLLVGKKYGSHSAQPDHWLLRLRDFLIAHCADSMDMGTIVEITNRHPVHISREFCRHFGKSISEFIRGRRILKAADLLKNSDLRLAEISLECGFCDQSHFTNTFRKSLGLTPSQYRVERRDRRIQG